MKRRWGQAAVAIIEDPIQDHECRVCRKPTHAHVRVLHKSWGVEYAHPACGWETEAEKEKAS